MPKKILNSDNKVAKEVKSKAETERVIGTVTKKQKEVIQSLIGNIGSTEQDVVGKILTIWLYNEGYLKEHNKN